MVETYPNLRCNRLPVLTQILAMLNVCWTPHIPLLLRVANATLPTICVLHFVGHGHNITSSHESMKNAIDRVRTTGAPFFLEFTTYRWREHCGHGFDNDIGYRTQEEFLEWQAKDPLNNLERELQQTSSQMAISLDKIKSEIDLEVKKAFDFAEESLFPAQSDAYDGVYA